MIGQLLIQPEANSVGVRIRKTLGRLAYTILLLLFYCIAASQAIESFSYKWTTVASNDSFGLKSVLDGSNPKPFAYRLLIPSVINGVVDHCPKQWLHPILERSKMALDSVIGYNHENNHKFVELDDKVASSYGLIVILDFVVFVTTLFLLRNLTKLLIVNDSHHDNFFVDFSPILFSLMIVISYRTHNGFVYDHFELFALVAYIYFSWKHNHISSTITLALAILNKETAFFFPVFGLAISYIRNQGLSLPKNWIIIIEFVVVIAGFISIRYMLRDHPGGPFEWHLPDNADFWMSTMPYLALTTPHFQLIPLPKPSNIIVLLPILFSIFGFWNKKPAVIRITLLISACINLPLFFAFCYRDEFRNLSLMFPFMYLAATHTIYMHYTKEHGGCLA